MRAGEGWDFPLFLEWVGFGWKQAVDPLEQNEEWAKEKPDSRNGKVWKEWIQQLALQMCW